MKYLLCLMTLLLSLTINNTLKANSFATSIRYSRLNLNGRPYESGRTLSTDFDVRFKLLPKLLFSTNLNYNYSYFNVLNEKASEKTHKLNGTLEGLYAVTSKHLIAFGTDTILEHESMKYEDLKAYRLKGAVGPSIGYSLVTKNLNIDTRVSAMFGGRKESYSNDEDLHFYRFKIKTTPKFWRVEIPLTVEVMYWSLMQKLTDYYSVDFRLRLQPELRVTKHTAIFADLLYNHRLSKDKVNLYEIGIGARVVW